MRNLLPLSRRNALIWSLLALAAGAGFLWRGTGTPEPVAVSASNTMKGTSALSHGGPAQVTTPGKMPARSFMTGQTVTVGGSDAGRGAVPLHQNPIRAFSTRTSPEIPSEHPRSLPSGTNAVIIAVLDDSSIATGWPERYYKVQASNGLIGWVSERSLRGHEPGPGR